MYRIFCESYRNFINTLDRESVRMKISEPIELIADINKYEEEKQKNSDLYKKLCDLMLFMQDNIERFPKLKAFLWTLSSRNIDEKKYNIASGEELEEQLKLVNSFLKLAYWY